MRNSKLCRGGILFLLLFGFAISFAYAQERTVTGKVTDTGNPLPGVNILIKGTFTGTITDADGNYRLEVEDPTDAILVFSFIGYTTQEISVEGMNLIDVTMTLDILGLEEVVVVGFGTQKKVNLTGAVVVIESEVFESRPVSNIADMLQGTTPGLNIKATSGDPTGTPTMNIRGIGTIGQGSSGNLLVLIDGMESDLYSVNPQDVESISVLKDAAASSIYGSRAPFGVILITTKSGKAGKIKVNYNNNFRWSSPINMPKWMDSYTFAKYQNEAAINAGQNPQFLEEHLQRIKDYQDGKIPPEVETTPSIWYTNRWAHAYEPNGAHANNDWHDIMFKDVVFSQEHNTSISGGNEKINFYVSGRYQDLGGVMNYNSDEAKKYNIYSKFKVQLTKWAEFKLSQRFFMDVAHRPHFATNNQLFGMLSTHGWPTNPQYDPNGYMYVAASWALPVKEGGDYDRTIKQKDTQVQFVLEPIKNWKTFAEFNYRLFNTRTKEDNRLLYNHDLNGNRYIHTADIRFYGTSQVWESYKGGDFFNTNIYSEYTKTLEGHTFKGMIGFQSEEYNIEDIFASRVGSLRIEEPFLNTTIGIDPITGTEIAPELGGGYNSWATIGFFARINYNYKERYLVETNIRYDGSSRFRSDSRWDIFPSVSLGWNLSKENFWNDLTSYVNNLKLRGSFGSLGNQNTYSYYPTYVTMPIGINNSGWLLNGGQANTAYVPGLIAKSLTWETVKNWNVGLDWGVLKNRLTGSFDYYVRMTENMVGPAPEMPATLGAAVPRMNNTDLKTSGWELLATWNDRLENGLGYSVTFTLADSKTKILTYPNESKALNTYISGQMMGDIWGYETVGIAKTQEEMDAHLASLPNGGQNAFGINWAAGDIMYADLNDDGKIDGGANTFDDPGDRKVIGNSMPRYIYSFTLAADYKGFDIRAFFQGVGKRDYWNGSTYFWGMNTSRWNSAGFTYHEDYFRPADTDSHLGPNVNAYFPRSYFGRKNKQTQTAYIQDVSYLRLKNLQFGYSLPNSIISQVSIEELRVFISGENLLTFTNTPPVFDPELIDVNSGSTYPLSKTWSIGLNVTF